MDTFEDPNLVPNPKYAPARAVRQIDFPAEPSEYLSQIFRPLRASTSSARIIAFAPRNIRLDGRRSTPR